MILEIILKWLIPFLLATLIGCISAMVKKLSQDNKAMKAGLLAIIRSQIVSKCEEYQSKKVLPEYARYCLEDLYKQYKVLGGNHGIEVLVEQTFSLPSAKRKGGKK